MYCLVLDFCLYVCKCERKLKQFLRRNLLDGYKYAEQLTYINPAVLDTPEAYQAEFGFRRIYDLDHLIKLDHEFGFICCL
jgi:hypothetical protein